MATILDLARHAEVSAEKVLRVVNGLPVSAAVRRRVHRAIDELGPPPYADKALELPSVEATIERARRQLLDSFAEAAAELEVRLPEDVGSVVYEAVRVEVRPVTAQLTQMGQLVEHLFERLEYIATGIAQERRERLDDVALITELITTGWRTVDRRLGRLERMVEELKALDGNSRAEVRRIYIDAPRSEDG